MAAIRIAPLSDTLPFGVRIRVSIALMSGIRPSATKSLPYSKKPA